MPSEYDEQRDSTDTQLPGEYDLFDLMAKVTEENLHAPVDSGPPVGREGVGSENGIYGHSRFCNTDFDDKLA
ncbi:AbrB/MazE/SpoVT family DNA-binding domain-containing protein, partial [Klebsiella pneumoniae]